MAGDKQESQLVEDNFPQWIRTIGESGSSKKTKANLFIKNSDRATIQKIKMPITNANAARIAQISTPNGFYNVSIFVKLDMFQLSCYGVIGIYMANSSISPFAKLSGFCISPVANILFVNNNSSIDIYITGNYSSSYNTYQSDIISSCELISFEEAGTIVPVSSLNVMKSINISEALKKNFLTNISSAPKM